MRIACGKFLILLFFVQSVGGDDFEADSNHAIDLDDARALFDQAKTLSEADDGALWGKRLYGPILFIDRATRFVVANVPDRDRRLKRAGDDVYIGTMPPEVSLGNTATEWAGTRWAMILWPVQPDATYSGTLMMHESFHRVQPDLGIPLAVPDNHHLDGATGRLWLRLEWRALLDAMMREKPLESDALQDALIFRAYRFSLIETAEEEERQLELNEGLAEYTGYRLGGLEPDQQRAAAINALRGYERSDTLVRSFAYACGPVYGMLLDDAMPNWRRHVRRSSSLGKLLMTAIRFKPPKNLQEEAVERSVLYDYESLLAEEANRELARTDRQADLRARFLDNPVLIIDLVGEFNYSFSPHDVHALDDVGTVYGRMHVNGLWGVLDAPGGVLRIETKRGRWRLVVPAPSDPETQPFTGDGWTLNLKPGWRLDSGPRTGDFRVARTQRR